jgi:2-haloalkanoic acid dehalogenase type II
MTHVPSSTPLTHFKACSFDVLGTLIDWESGMYNSFVSLEPISSIPPNHPMRDRKNLLQATEACEREIQVKHPDMEYSILLAEIFKTFCKQEGLESEHIEENARTFAKSIEHWPPFPDTLDALKKLQKFIPILCPLSNSSPTTLGPCLKNALPGFEFSAVYTAKEIGSYKPDLRNFEYLLKHVKEEFGVEKDQLLHVAQSLFHDHVPANKMGIESVWVDRQGAMGHVKAEFDCKYGWEVKTLGELADQVEKAFDAKK